ncbi:MAG: EAL domain-containing protein [Solirubrobacterales bacterium]|nr:EAL domain-containing protein [Solirubrobacterales bacterium]
MQAPIACQPIVDLCRGTVVGYEALARFTGPPAAPPDRWFAEARRQGSAPP